MFNKRAGTFKLKTLLLAPVFLAAAALSQNAAAYGAVWSYGQTDWTKHNAPRHKAKGARWPHHDLRWKMGTGIGEVNLPTEAAARKSAEDACKQAENKNPRERCRIEVFRNRCASVAWNAILSGEPHSNGFLAAFGASQKRVRRAHLYKEFSRPGEKSAAHHKQTENKIKRKCGELKSRYNYHEQKDSRCDVVTRCDTRP